MRTYLGVVSSGLRVLDCHFRLHGGRSDSGEVLRPVGPMSGNDSSEVGCQLLDEHLRVLLRQRLQWREQSPHRRVVFLTKL